MPPKINKTPIVFWKSTPHLKKKGEQNDKQQISFTGNAYLAIAAL
jgi:hypothetical protein